MKSIGDLAAHFRKEWGLEDKPLAEPKEFDLQSYLREQRMNAFKRFCPEEFLKAIDRRKIRNLVAWDLADQWDGSFPGLWLWSHDTGEAKTRMLWRKFGQCHVEKGMTVQRTTGLNLSEEYHDAYQKNRTSDFYRHIVGCQVVMLDDLDKMALPNEQLGYSERDQGARNGRMIRELFDTFYEEHIRVVVTANEPIKWFAERIGESAERRMRSVCVEIPF